MKSRPGSKQTDKLLFKSQQPRILYDKPEVYAGMTGVVVRKDHQSFESDHDSGTIIYIEYEKDISGREGFFEGLFWVEISLQRYPEEFVMKGEIF